MKPDRTRIESFLGIRSDVTPERMSPGDLIDAINVRFDKTGQMFRRDGSARQMVGIAHSAWGDGEVALVVFSNVLSRINADMSLTSIQAGLRPGRVLSYERINGLVYWTNGEVSGVFNPGNNTGRTWGMQIPAPVDHSIVSGSMPEGIYQFALTFLRADGQESGASLSTVVTVPEGGGLYVTAPTSDDPEVIRVVLYLSTAGGKILYRAAEIAPGQVGGYRGNTLDLTLPIMTQFMVPPPPAQTLGWMNGRMWLGIDEAIYPSAPFSLELFNLMEYLPIDGTVTMIAPQREGWGMWVGSTKGLYYLMGKDPKDMEIKKQSDHPVIAGTLLYVPGDKFGTGDFQGVDIPVWASSQGLCAGLPTPEGKVQALTEGRNPFELAGRGASYFDGESVVASAATYV